MSPTRFSLQDRFQLAGYSISSTQLSLFVQTTWWQQCLILLRSTLMQIELNRSNLVRQDTSANCGSCQKNSSLLVFLLKVAEILELQHQKLFHISSSRLGLLYYGVIINHRGLCISAETEMCWKVLNCKNTLFYVVIGHVFEHFPVLVFKVVLEPVCLHK